MKILDIIRSVEPYCRTIPAAFYTR